MTAEIFADDILLVTNDKGLLFGVTIVREGEHYGLNGVLVHNEARPLVEFYDMRYPFWPLKPDSGADGQFVSRYYADTLLGRDAYSDGPHRHGLDLDGGIDAWKIDAAAMTQVIDWILERVDG